MYIIHLKLCLVTATHAQLQVGENYTDLFNLRPNICKSWFLKTYFIPIPLRWSNNKTNLNGLAVINASKPFWIQSYQLQLT